MDDAQRLGHRDAEVLLVRGQRKDIACVERAPLHLAAQHAGPAHACADAARLGLRLQPRYPSRAIGARDHEVRLRVQLRHAGKGLDQQVAAFLLVHAAKKQDDALALQLRVCRQETLAQRHAAGVMLRGGRLRAEAHDGFPGAVQPEGLAGQAPLFFRGKQHGSRIAQHAVLGPRPVEPLLQVLARVGVLEPGIEHAVRVDVVRHLQLAQRAPCAKAMVLPQAVDDDRVELLRMLAQPGHQPG